MGDILSGGKIDESTSGPVPPKVDDRKTDILGEQKDKQDRSAIGGTQFPPRAQPPPPIPEAAQLIPVLPSFQPPPPSFSSEISIDTRETARQAVIDVLKNVTINGQGPSIEGSSISFNVPQETKQSEITFSQPIYQAPPPTPQQPTVSQQTQPPQPQQQFAQPANVQAPRPEDNIISVVLEPPRKTSAASYQSGNVEPQIQSGTPPKTTIPPQNLGDGVEFKNAQDNTGFNQGATPSLQPPKTEPQDNRLPAPSRLQSPDFGSSKFNDQSDSAKAYQKAEDSKDERDIEIRPYNVDSTPPQKQESPAPSRLHAPDFAASKDLDRGQPERESRLHAPDFGASKDLDKGQPERESRLHAPDFGAPKDLDKGQPVRESRLHADDFGSSDFNKQSSSAKAYEEGERRREERKQQDPSFDRESSIRQKGETPREFKERQENIREEKALQEEASKGNISAALASGLVPVALKRADGEKSIIAYLNSSFVGITEGAVKGERVTDLPDDQSYYTADGSGASSCTEGFGLYKKTVRDKTQIWIYPGTIGGELPNGFNPLDGKLLGSSGAATVYAQVIIDGNNGKITSSNIHTGSMPSNGSDTTAYYELGYYEVNKDSASTINYGCGSIRVVVCRNWYATKSPYYTVRLER